ncbi:hypothetical protein [Acidiplasma sp.]|uniref:hypothetical protein n=1 Tax=Acidiplasma sp. TaxID=1872114 RepID=UPI0025893DBC|nr:hypothetical protein [Acidiplasma sp.]
MIIEDYRRITCGGDPFNYLIGSLKGLYLDTDSNVEVKLILDSNRFNYDIEKFIKILDYTGFNLLEYKKNEDIELRIRKI